MAQSQSANPFAAEIDAFLRSGGVIVAASDRAARAIVASFHRARQSEGLTAWPSPRIHSWRSFVESEFAARTHDGRLLLNAAQEQALWADIAARRNHPATALAEPRHRIAALASRAHELLAGYAPRYLQAGARAAWQNDAAEFSRWLSAFDDACRDGNLLSQSRLPLELSALLESDHAARPPLLLAGFDRILPVQRAVLEAWGEWREPVSAAPAADLTYFDADDENSELAACALWSRLQLERNPDARLLVIAPNPAANRGEMERAMLRHLGSATPPLFEFSLGVPLSQVPIAKAAHLLLRWLTGPIAEYEIDSLISTGFTAANSQETAALARQMRELRRRSLSRAQWTLNALCRAGSASTGPPEMWARRMSEAQRRLAAPGDRERSPLEWAALVSELLRAARWPGSGALASAEFQAVERWQQAVETCGSLGFDGRRVPWREFVSMLGRELEDSLFALESRGAPIQIAGAAESAGLTADAIWVLSASEDSWPAAGSAHPFLPLRVQREAGMPHASAQLDWDLARTIAARIISSASSVRFSYARQTAIAESRPSRLIVQLSGAAQPLPAALLAAPAPAALTVICVDAGVIPFAGGSAPGGASVLSFQSQCPFKAFAITRLAAKSWLPAAPALTPPQRGSLVHAVLHSVWAGPPNGVRTLNELRAILDLDEFVSAHVERALRKELNSAMREQMPAHYLALEQPRLTRIVRAWLDYELKRKPFAVLDTEVSSQVSIAGLELALRLDRIDELSDGTLLVIDYKTGPVTPQDWDPPRPVDVQLPLYATSALPDGVQAGGLVFARVQAGDIEFAGRVRSARATLLESATGNLARKPLDDDQLEEWQRGIRALAEDFIAGRREADPREYPDTCERCGLHTLCRISETRARIAEDDNDRADAEDE